MKKITSSATTKILSATAILTVVMLTSCSKESELDTIKDAQMCLNKATTATAQSCVTKLAAIDTDQSNQLKCAAYFIQEGFGSPTALINAIEAAENSNGSTGSMNMISELSFSNATQSGNAFNVCSDSGIAVYTQLSSLVQISTLAKVAGGLTDGATPADYETAIASVPSAALGELATATYASSCNGSASTSGEALTEYCTELADVIAGATATEIGDCLKEKLSGNNVAGCPLF